MFGISKAEKAKQTHKIEDLIRSCGIELKQKGASLTGLCPFHDDKTPSLSVTPEKGLWHCFGCDAGGSVIDWVARHEKISEREAINKLCNHSPIQNNDFSRIQKEISKDHLLDEISTLYHQNFLQNAKAREYLINRGIKDTSLFNRFKIGYSDGGSLKKVIPEKGDMVEQLQSLGILNDSGNESFYKCVTFPIKNGSERIVGMFGRSIEGDRKHYLKGNHKGIWNSEAALAYKTILLTESIIDALSVLQLGILNVIPIYGTNGLTEHHLKLFENCRTEEIILCMDNDAAGNKAIEKHQELLSLKGFKLSYIQLPQGIKDLNLFLTSGGTKEQLEEIIKNRTSLNSKPNTETGLVSKSKDDAHFKYDNLFYRIRGIALKNLGSMRVVITVNGESPESHTDRVDLYVSKARKIFANAAAGKLKAQSAKVEENLLSIMAEIEKIEEQEELSKYDSTSKPIFKITDEECKEAMAFLKKPDLLDRIVMDFDICGYVGEAVSKKLCYLSATSRIMRKPFSAIVRAGSAGGKSELMTKTSEFMPSEQVETYTRITAMGLYYMQRDHLRNKLVIIDEKGGSDEADYSIRSLQSKDKLSLALPIKDPSTGKTETRTIEMFGPCVIWYSTTQLELNPENLNRSFEVYLDESLKQTEAILNFQKKARTLEGWNNEKEKQKIIRIHQNAQRLLKQVKIIIPFTHLIDFPVKWLRVRRDHDRFLSLIEAVTFLYQFQREQKQTIQGDAYIEATMEDYKNAYELAQNVLVYSLQDLSKPAADFYSSLKNIIKIKSKASGVKSFEYKFTRREIREETSLPDHQIRRILDELVDMEYVNRIGGSQGKKVYYTLPENGSVCDVLAGLTKPEDLQRRILKVKL